MIRVNKTNPCPVCGRTDWCLIAEDGSACICARINDGSIKRVGDAGWLHKFQSNPLKTRIPPRVKKQEETPTDFTLLAKKYYQQLGSRKNLSEELGVSVGALDRLRVGWNKGAYTFPMRDGNGKIVGIRYRGKDRKWSEKGSKNGLFIPSGIRGDMGDKFFICEGPTDTAALLDLGFCVIGRASCNTGLKYILEMIKYFRRDVIIFSDKDEAKISPTGKVFYPGQDGAASLAEGLEPFTHTIKIIKPPFEKDVRAWVSAGATQKDVMRIIENTRFHESVSH